MESIIFWMSVVIASIWSLGWLIFNKHGFGCAIQLFSCILMWVCIFKAFHNNFSDYNLLWLMPLSIIVGSFVGLVLHYISILIVLWEKYIDNLFNPKE